MKHLLASKDEAGLPTGNVLKIGHVTQANCFQRRWLTHWGTGHLWPTPSYSLLRQRMQETGVLHQALPAFRLVIQAFVFLNVFFILLGFYHSFGTLPFLLSGVWQDMFSFFFCLCPSYEPFLFPTVSEETCNFSLPSDRRCYLFGGRWRTEPWGESLLPFILVGLSNAVWPQFDTVRPNTTP